MFFVNNTCHSHSTNGTIKFGEAKGWLTDDSGAKHKHRFFGLITGDIWVSDVANDSSWIIFGHPTRNYLWILSRTPTMNETLYKGLVKFVERDGYPVEKLVKSIQTCGNNYHIECKNEDAEVS